MSSKQKQDLRDLFPLQMSSRQRARLRKLSGQTALARQRSRDDARQIASAHKAHQVSKSQAKSGKALLAFWRAQEFVGSGKWTSYPFHHGRTFVRKNLADKGCSTPL